MNNDLKTLKEAIDLMVQEVLGKFDFNKFKKIASGDIRKLEPRDDGNRRMSPHHLPSEFLNHPEIAYARDFLPIQSSGEAEGSSRCVFAYSGGKVLKIAMNQAGIAQNEAEVEIYKANSNNGVVTKVYDYAPDCKWVIAELVKPFTGSEFNTFLGMSADTFQHLIYGLAAGRSLERIFNVNELEDSIRYYNVKLGDLSPEGSQTTRKHYVDKIENYERDLKQYKNIKPDSATVKFAMDVIVLMNKHDLADGDIALAKHYGRNVSGQIKLYDYGATQDIIDKHYSGRRYSDDDGTSDEHPNEEGSSSSRFGV